MTNVLTFSKAYKKLSQQTFSTIRRCDKGFKPGQVVFIRGVNGWLGPARILLKHKKTLRQLMYDSTEFLFQDTDCTTLTDALKLLNSFYNTPIKIDEVFTIYYLVWEKIYKKNPNSFQFWDFSNKVSNVTLNGKR